MGAKYQNMALQGQALLVLTKTPYKTGGKKLCARFMDINHPVVSMQILLHWLYTATVMVSFYVRLLTKHCIMLICIAGCGHLVPCCWYIKRHIQAHTGEYIPFKCMKGDLQHELRSSMMPFNCMKCDIIYLPIKIFRDTRVMILNIYWTVWECRLLEILSSKCQ